MADFTFATLTEIIADKARSEPSTSYTAQLVQGPMERCAKKLGEEAVETVIAAMGGDRQALISETADMLYHLLVLLHKADVSFDAVLQELEHRTGQSGLAEKAARPKA
jgi:phosphoribosyl-ATP pyrophosphohydrolase